MSQGASTPLPASTAQGRQLFSVVLASCVGTAMEWYDFFIYGFVATLMFDKLFFPNMTSAVGTLVVLGTFSVGFVARPVGGLVFAHFGDRFGRKRVLLITMVLMGVSTTTIGLLPTYASAGTAAPVLLIVCRFLQGIALGGESIGALLMIIENAPPHRRGFLGAIVMATGPFAQVIGSFVLMAIVSLPDQQLLAWGWRVPFLLSLVLLFVGSYVRFRVEESPLFLNAQREHKIVRVPLVEVLTRYR
ncbi:MAG TPA: MFS transporter, partial [Stellaceae bacterium]|nr:MFS transporter [Stellaceae bacterium]